MFRILRASINFDQDDTLYTETTYDNAHFEHTADHRSTSHSDRHGLEIDPVLAGYYSNLEVPYGSDLETVRRAWKRLVRKYHPDLHSKDPEKRRVANELTQGLNRAYEELAKRL